MKLFAETCTAAALSLGLSMSAAALPVFSDDFDRANSNAVGNGWTEDEAQPSDVAIQNGVLQLRGDDPLGAAWQLSGISTMGYTDITLSYDWGPITQSDPGDFLTVSWRDGSDPGNPWMLLANHELDGGAGMTPTLWSIAGAGIADLELRFLLEVDFSNEGAYIDNVVLSGTPLAGQQPGTAIPEPGTLFLAGLSLGLLGLARRR